MVRKENTYYTQDSKKSLPKIDFSDTFSTTNHEDSLEEISTLIFDNPTKWVAALLKLRNRIVTIFGLKTTKPNDYNTEFKVGSYVGFFKIYQITESEVILGANDKHLNFRAILNNSYEDQYNIKATTLVEYNNVFGRIYMGIVAPFHKIIMKVLVNKAYKVSSKLTN